MRAAQRWAATRSRPDTTTSDPPVLRAGTIPDLLAGVPALLGFRPRRSLVAIAMHGTTLGFRLRFDLPSPEYVEPAAARLAPPLLAQRPDAVLLIAYVDPEPLGGRSADRLAADGLVAELGRLIADADVEVREAIRCDGERYWSYHCTVATCCPPEGTPYDIESSPMLAKAVYNGVEVLAGREDLERRFEPVAGPRRAEMSATTDRVVDELLIECGSDPDLGPATSDEEHALHGRLLRRGADFVAARIDGLANRPDPGDEDAALLGFFGSLVPLRDLAWSGIDRDGARDHLRLWTSVAQRVVPPFEPAPLCLAAFAAWLCGDGTQARCALDRARRVAPEYTMGRLLERTLDGCVPPDAWRPLDSRAIWASIPGADDRGHG